MRRIKSPAEIEKLRELAGIATTTMEAAIDATRPGVTENEIAAAAYQAAFAAGAERMTDFFAVAGRRSFMKNVMPMPGKRVQPDELVEFDMNLELAGYIADHARNTVAGHPSAEVREILDLSLEAHQAGLAATKPGATVNEIMRAMHDVITAGGWAEWDWSTGHGFGLDLAEAPMFIPQNNEPLEPGMCFYLEPMIVPSHIGTACPEDMILVTDSGCEQLTTSRCATGRAAPMRHHWLRATEQTVKLGLIDRTDPPVLSIESGDEVSIETWSGWGNAIDETTSSRT